jgi:glycosyltransferase involved in cell wall biosynthesis
MNYSVLMAVYYREKPENLSVAMQSVWNQTVVTDDFVLVCDGPLSDALDSVIEKMRTSHAELTVIRLNQNGGLGKALN